MRVDDDRLPNTIWNSGRLCSLPLFPAMREADVARVVDAIQVGASPERAMTVWRLSVVVPVLDEEASLPELIRRCLAVFDALDYRCELILVDDGSRDASPLLIRDAAHRHRGRVVGVILNRNYGQHAAVIAGLAEARGDVVVTIDADLQNPPEEIPKLLPHVEDGCDVVGSVRLARRDHWLRRIASSLVNRLVRRATGVMMHDYGCMLRAYRRPVVDAILRCGERSTFVPILANCFAGRTISRSWKSTSSVRSTCSTIC